MFGWGVRAALLLHSVPPRLEATLGFILLPNRWALIPSCRGSCLLEEETGVVEQRPTHPLGKSAIWLLWRVASFGFSLDWEPVASKGVGSQVLPWEESGA